MRGEYKTAVDAPSSTTELPPRARRILSRHEGIRLEHGTTSACAENTSTVHPGPQGAWNYLRVRGEYHLAEMISKGLKELPPRARRILKASRVSLLPSGTTSACAENTVFPDQTRPTHRNYLRVRGEYGAEGGAWFAVLELPPRARRIRHIPLCDINIKGTTSACAENTDSWCTPPTHPWNYLRVRGEYSPCTMIRSWVTELPPRARRIQGRWLGNVEDYGTTSACAENTSYRQ